MSTSRQTVFVSLLSVLGVLLALVNGVFVGYFYGASEARDAFLVALVVPSYIASVFAGNVSLIFVPVFVRRLQEDREQAWRMASGFVCASVASLVCVTLLVAAFSTQAVAFIAPTYGPERLALAASLLRVLMPSSVFGGAIGVLGSLYYAERRFFLPSIAPLINTCVFVLCNVTLHSFIGIHSLAVGSTLGSIVAVGLLLPGVVGKGKLHLSLDWRDPALLQVVRGSLPLVAAGLVYHFNDGFERMLSSRLPVGSVSYLSYANQIKTALGSVTVAGIAKTIVPPLSEAWARGDLVAVRRYYAIGIRSILMVALPAIACLSVFGSTVITTLYQRGAFSPETTFAVTQCLHAMLLSYLAASLGAVVTNCFYVTRRTVVLSIYTVAETGIYIALGWYLTQLASYQGLAFAVSLRDTVSVLIYLGFASVYFKGIGARGLLLDLAKIGSAALACALVGLCVRAALAPYLHPFLVACLGVSLGGGVYLFLAVRVFRIEEAARLLVLLRTRR